jgi:hypothetical protein
MAQKEAQMRLFQTEKWIFLFLKMWQIFWLDERLSLEDSCTMKLFLRINILVECEREIT